MSETTVDRVIEIDDRVFCIQCHIDPDEYKNVAEFEEAVDNMAFERIGTQLTIEAFLDKIPPSHELN